MSETSQCATQIGKADAEDKPRLIVHATNVHQGGGSTLLFALLSAAQSVCQVVAQLDSRMMPPFQDSESVDYRFVEPTIWQRICAEWWLAKHVREQDIVLCFGNLPPLFKLSGRVVVFVQNRYLVEDAALTGFPLKTRIRLSAERLWMAARMQNADEYVVQTPSMRKLLGTRTDVPVQMLPFSALHEEYARAASSISNNMTADFDFIYVASGEPHKNHRKLIEAWCLLAEAGIYPSLKLTLNKAEFSDLCSWVEQKIIQYRLHVANLGSIPHEMVVEAYTMAGALIYPSTFESFGLPLIEARQAGLPILASELDYVRDVIDPVATFDPRSEVSIARAVKRFLGVEERPLPLLGATQFLASILEKAE